MISAAPQLSCCDVAYGSGTVRFHSEGSYSRRSPQLIAKTRECASAHTIKVCADSSMRIPCDGMKGDRFYLMYLFVAVCFQSVS